jgi:hypothetical protein
MFRSALNLGSTRTDFPGTSMAASKPPLVNMVWDKLKNTCDPLKELVFEDEIDVSNLPPGHMTLVEFMNTCAACYSVWMNEFRRFWVIRNNPFSEAK